MFMCTNPIFGISMLVLKMTHSCDPQVASCHAINICGMPHCQLLNFVVIFE